MAYEFRLRMTGVIALLGEESRVRVVLPNALLGDDGSGARRRKDKRRAVDGQPLIRHEPVLQRGNTILASPRGHRIRIELGSASEALVRDLATLPHMAEVLPDACALDDDFREPTDPGKVAAVLDVTQGRLVATPPPGLQAELAPLQGPGPTPRPMSGDFLWSVPMSDGEKVRISLEPFGGSSAPVTIIELDGRSGDETLLLANLTAQVGGKQPDPPREDYDFLWYYELLPRGTRDSVEQLLKKERKKAPVPVCVEGCADGAGPGEVTILSTGGQKCRPCVFC